MKYKNILQEIPESLHRQLKIKAAEKGTTLKKVIEQALLDYVGWSGWECDEK